MKSAIGEIRGNPRNPRVIADEAFLKLCQSIERDPEFMRLRPLVADEDGVIIGGNQRLKACEHLGYRELPEGWVVKAGPLTKAQRDRFIMIDNSPEGMSGVWDLDAMKNTFDLVDLEACGFDLSGDLGGDEEPDKLPVDSTLNNSTILQLRQDVIFDGAKPWDIPNLRPDMMLDGNASPTLFFPGEHSEGLLMWNYNSDSTKLLDWRRTIVSFYVEDIRFECFWNDTPGHIAPMMNRKIAGMVTPNFSCYYEMPATVRLWNVFRSRWIGRFAQEAGIRIIPDISGAPADVDWMFDGLPKGCPVSIQVHREQQTNSFFKNQVLQACIEKVSPSVVWCYGQAQKAEWYPALKGVDCRWITPRTVKMTRRIKDQQNG